MASFSNRLRGLSLREDLRQQAGDLNELNRMQPSQGSTQPEGWRLGRTLRGREMMLDTARGQAVLDQNLDNSLRAWVQQGLSRRGQEFSQDLATKQYEQGVRAYEESPRRVRELGRFQSQLSDEALTRRQEMERESQDYRQALEKDMGLFRLGLQERMQGDKPAGDVQRVGNGGFGFGKGMEPKAADVVLIRERLKRAGYDMEGVDDLLLEGAMREAVRSEDPDKVITGTFADRDLQDAEAVLSRLRKLDGLDERDEAQQAEYERLSDQYVRLSRGAQGGAGFNTGLALINSSRNRGWLNDPAYVDRAQASQEELASREEETIRAGFEARRKELAAALQGGSAEQKALAKQLLDGYVKEGVADGRDVYELSTGRPYKGALLEGGEMLTQASRFLWDAARRKKAELGERTAGSTLRGAIPNRLGRIQLTDDLKAGEKSARMALGRLDRKSDDFESRMSRVFKEQDAAGQSWLLKKFPDFDFRTGTWK